MGTVHQFAARCNPPNVPVVEEVVQALRRVVDAQLGPEAGFDVREEAALALANDATRRFLEEDLQAIAARHGHQVEVDGRVYQRHEPGTVRYYTLCGALDIERWTRV